MTPFEQQQVSRILSVVEALKNTARSLERQHETDAAQAIEYFDKAPPLAVADRGENGLPEKASTQAALTK
jgi:hypothetical protein